MLNGSNYIYSPVIQPRLYYILNLTQVSLFISVCSISLSVLTIPLFPVILHGLPYCYTSFKNPINFFLFYYSFYLFTFHMLSSLPVTPSQLPHPIFIFPLPFAFMRVLISISGSCIIP